MGAGWRKIWLECLLISLTVLALRVASLSSSPYPFRCDRTPEQHKLALDTSIRFLELEGFKVEHGEHTYGHATEFSANPSTLYGFFKFGITPFFTLDEADALVFYGCTPPAMRYFSYTPYVFTTPQLNRTIVFASLQDPVNSLTIRTAHDATFSSSTLIIMTASVRTDAAVRTAFEPNLESSAMNTLKVSKELVKLGSGATSASALMLLSRVAIYANETECELYTNSTFPVLKVTRPKQGDEPVFGLPSLRSRYTGVTEDHLETTLAELAIAVIGKVTQAGYRIDYQARMERFPLDARECIAKGEDCLGDCPDAAYFADPKKFRMGSETNRDLFMVVGVNHRMLGSATYTNFGLDPFVAVTDDKFGDSAAHYLPSAPGIHNFFAYKVTRKCSVSDFYCLEVPVDKVKPTDEVRFTGRVYLNPKTTTGPAYNETIPNYLLHFRPEIS
ncbi:uncharacterized protein LOC135826014 [Sycon ciliatum]|uniref:uncharacterized protein LOC135826014 n=1 Tax=Sycon ciliatum TaxID=27933 RepID=UPI0031F6DA09